MTFKLANSKVLGALFVVSIAVNLFLGGLMMGRFTGDAAQRLQSKRNLNALIDALPAAKQPLLREELRVAIRDIRRITQTMQTVQVDLAKELSKPELDQEKIDRQFAELQRHSTAMQATLQQAFKRAAVQLTVEERRALLAALKQQAPTQAMPDL